MITIVALLSIRDSDAFGQFERQAIRVMQAHGGRLESAFRPTASEGESGQGVDEIHVLKFPDQQAFDRYRRDDRLRELADLRKQAISQTTVYVSSGEVDYSS